MSLKILHVLPHLGGGVGKAHAALCRQLEGRAEQAYILLEKPVDGRYIAELTDVDATVMWGPFVDLFGWIDWADVVQIEWWDHPFFRGFIAQWRASGKPVALWSHQSKPVTANVASLADRLIGTAPVCNLPFTINSGFGFEGVEPKTEYGARVGYLGTVDFKKLDPMFFEVAERLSERPVVWGSTRLPFDVLPPHVDFRGYTDNPVNALKDIDIFFYPLQPDHYGTGENALVEAMSAGCCPVVLNNPCEAAIIEDGVTGFVCNDAEECYEAIKYLQTYPNEIRRMGQAAARYAAEHKTAAQSAQQFLDLWSDLIGQPHESHGAVSPLPVLGAD